MSGLTLVPAWIIQDLFVFAAALFTIFFIIRKEEHRESILMEMLCFVFLYAAVYENFATIVGYYAYGRSLLMVGNVPLSVPVVEYLVVYSMLRLLKHTEVPAWSKPFIVGLAAMLFDFALDPLAITMVFPTPQGTVGRWTWFLRPGDAAIFGEPVFNFPGWVLICGWAAASFLLGRWWHRRSGHSRAVGFLYPVLGSLVSLGLVVSPVSRFLLWLEPFFRKGSAGEWIMLGVWLTVPTALFIALWRGRMREKFPWKENLPVLATLVGLPAVTVVSTAAYGALQVLWLELAAAAALGAAVLAVCLSRRGLSEDAPRRRPADYRYRPRARRVRSITA
jgi:hypothetical protein